MSATPITAANAREQALQGISDGFQQVAEAFHLLAVTEAPYTGPRLVSTARELLSVGEPEVLLNIKQAQELLGGCSRRLVERLVAGKPCRRKAGRKVLVERAGLLALTKRG
jgi:hypothetical protein